MELHEPDTERRRFHPVQLLLAVNAVGLLLAAVWFRCRLLGNVPGVNGDEAWYGVKAWQFLWEQQLHVQTPTGNPPNGFFLGPLVLLHVFFRPSIVLLRSVAVGSGLAALAINWALCRWVFDRRTAAITTLVLALLPINIAYSRFAWDASQSVAATLPVLYFSLAAVRFPEGRRRHIGAAIVAQVLAALVHPTNIFAGVAIVVAVASRAPRGDVKPAASRGVASRRVLGGLLLAIIVLSALVVFWRSPSGSGRFVRRIGGLEELLLPKATPGFPVLYPRLFTGGTTYRYIPGSRSWLEWPSAPQTHGWGIDLGLFWAMLAAAVWFLWRSWKAGGRKVDLVLIAAWAWTLFAFLLIAGPRAMMPGWERWALCLVGPTVVLAARGMALGFEASSRKWKLALGAAALAGWLVLADYHVHYFRFIERTGGRSHETFRTAPVELKQAALRTILQHRRAGKTYIVASGWHNCWPLRYLAMAEDDVHVVNPKEAEASEGFGIALRQGRVWHVEYSGSEGWEQARAALAGRKVRQWQLKDYGGRPVLCVLHGE